MAEIISGFSAFINRIGFVRQVRQINEKYRTPKIKTTPMVRVALLLLRLYLIFLVLLLGFRFFTQFHF